MSACQNNQVNDIINKSDTINNVAITNIDTIQEKVIKTKSVEIEHNIKVHGVIINISKLDSIEKNIYQIKPSSPAIRILQDQIYSGYVLEEGIDTLKWFELMEKENKFHLKRTKIDINLVMDEVEGGLTAKEIVVEDDTANTLLLISGVNNLLEGEVVSFKLKWPFNPGDTMSFTCKNESFKIYASDEKKVNDQYLPIFYFISSSSDNHDKKQLFAMQTGFGEANFTFMWAGDLDKDDRLDLIMDISNLYSTTTIALFLSSVAENGEFLKLVTTLSSSGS
jgi:hypothetical protein